MIQLIIFDLDGVLVDSRPLHYRALNLSLEEIHEKYMISEEEHLAKYDGLPTSTKLKMLTAEKGLPTDTYNTVWQNKQKYTIQAIRETIGRDDQLIDLFKTLKSSNYQLYCASNSIWNTIKMTLLQLGILEYIDFFLSNEEVKNPKPYPEMYLKCIERSKLSTKEVLICEDSPVGREAAVKSGAWLCPIENRSDLTLKKISEYIKMAEQTPLPKLPSLKKLNVVIPMAGNGSRFAQAGYSFPKPLIEVKGKPMIQVVVDNLNIPNAKFIFIVQKSHFEKYHLDQMLKKMADKIEVVLIDATTEGAACSVLLAEKYIDSEEELIIANSDQFLEWDVNEFLYTLNSQTDAVISTFYNTHPKWSYARVDDQGWVVEVQEKNPISTIATTGVYYWKRGSDFVKYAKRMIAKNIRVNNEFYVCPVFNEAVLDGKKIRVKDCKKMWGLGTPEDLEHFLREYKGEV